MTLSNGSTSVAAALFERAGIQDRFEQLRSVEDAGVWKPAPRLLRLRLVPVRGGGVGDHAGSRPSVGHRPGQPCRSEHRLAEPCAYAVSELLTTPGRGGGDNRPPRPAPGLTDLPNLLDRRRTHALLVGLVEGTSDGPAGTLDPAYRRWQRYRSQPGSGAVGPPDCGSLWSGVGLARLAEQVRSRGSEAHVVQADLTAGSA